MKFDANECRNQTLHTTGRGKDEATIAASLVSRDEMVLEIEPLEEVIAPLLSHNHNETLVAAEVELSLEVLEEVIAPTGVIIQVHNHNETLVATEVELSPELLEEVIAPIMTHNHNETLVAAKVELSLELLEDVIAPQGVIHH
jgi:hypothetical protein